MKKIYKILFILLLVCILPYKTAAADTLQPTDEFYVNDFADVINEDVEGKILKYGKQLENQTGAQVVLVTIDFADGESLENYALNLFNEWGIGSEKKNNGLLIILSIGDDDYWAMQGEGLEDTLTSGKISSILQEYLEPDFAAKDYSAGVEKTYSAFVQELGGQWKDDSEETDKKSSNTIDQYTFDNADIISGDTKDYINKNSTETKELYDAGFYIVTKDSCEDGLSFQADTINTFEELNAGSRDVLLVLYKDDDNYWLLPGEESEEFATEKVLRDIMDNALEPEFAAKDYSRGAADTANRFYDLFKDNFIKIKGSTSTDSNNLSESSNNQLEKNDNPGPVVAFLFFAFAIFFLISRSRKRHYFNMYGVPFNPYSARYIRRYGPGGYWGHHGYPSMGRGDSNGRRISRPNHNDSSEGAGRSTSKSSFWGSSGGAGRSSSSGGAGRSSSSGGAGRSSSSGGAGRSSSSGGFTGNGGGASHGGVSRGGGAGRSSGGIGRSSSSGHASGGGRSSSGGGGSSRGGGAGRNK